MLGKTVHGSRHVAGGRLVAAATPPPPPVAFGALLTWGPARA